MNRKFKAYTSLLLLSVFAVISIQGCEDDERTMADPVVSSFSHSSGGPVGTYVEIKGKYFSSTAGNNVVKFNGTEATILTASPALITTTVPAGATSGKITVTVDGRTATSETDFAVTSGVPEPVILKFDPKSGIGVDNTAITITGLNFSTTPANNTVKFNNVTAMVTEASATSLKAVVPSGSTTGKITVAVPGAAAVATSADDFTVPSPSVSKFIPTASTTGSTVVVYGTNFSKTPANNIVKFNNVAGTVSSVNEDGSLNVTVPGGATDGKISVTVDSKTGESKDSFTVN